MDSGVPSATELAAQTFELFEVGIALVRQRLRREHPQASEEEIDRELAQWLLRRPGAEYGDAGPTGFRPRRAVA